MILVVVKSQDVTQHYYPFSWQANDDDNNEHVCHYWICFQHKFPGNVYVTLLTVIKIRKYNGYKKNSQWNKLADKSAIRINRINTVVTNLPGVNKNNRTLIQLIYRFEIVQTYTWKCTYKNLHTSVCSDISALLFFFFWFCVCACALMKALYPQHSLILDYILVKLCPLSLIHWMWQ